MTNKSSGSANITNSPDKLDILPGYDSEKRPWGEFVRFTHNQLSTVKTIYINPGHRNSLQKHGMRTELWIVASGNPTICIGKELEAVKEYHANPGDQFIVNCGDWHRFFGGDLGAMIIEISLGNFDEDDIVRDQDDYNRAPKK